MDGRRLRDRRREGPCGSGRGVLDPRAGDGSGKPAKPGPASGQWTGPGRRWFPGVAYCSLVMEEVGARGSWVRGTWRLSLTFELFRESEMNQNHF